MGKYTSKISTSTLTILKEKICICSKQLKDNETFTEINNKKTNNKPNEIIWELEEMDYSCEPIYI